MSRIVLSQKIQILQRVSYVGDAMAVMPEAWGMGG
jgi:hypothetical protein